jgi:hypothetical protein
VQLAHERAPITWRPAAQEAGRSGGHLSGDSIWLQLGDGRVPELNWYFGIVQERTWDAGVTADEDSEVIRSIVDFELQRVS